MKAFNTFVIILFVGVVAFIAFHLVRDSRKKYYSTTRMEITTLEEKLVFPGFVYPGKEIEIKPQISGVVDKLFISVGDYVIEGDAVASVILVPNASEVEQLQSNVNIAEINMNAAQNKYDRQKRLVEKDYISREEFEVSEREYLSAKENYDSALRQLNLRMKGNHSANNVVRATTSGVVIDIPVKVGSSVMERSLYNVGTTIVTLAGTERFVFKGNIPETDISRIRSGMPVILTIPAYGDLVIPAVIVKISAKGEMQNGAIKFPVEAEFVLDGNEFVLRSGYSAVAEILLARSENVLSLPEKCIGFKGDTSFVRVLDTLGNIVREQIVVLGLSDGERVEIRSGLSETDAVIIDYYD